MTDILMPALSPTMEEGTLTKWHIKAGDSVSAGQGRFQPGQHLTIGFVLIQPLGRMIDVGDVPGRDGQEASIGPGVLEGGLDRHHGFAAGPPEAQHLDRIGIGGDAVRDGQLELGRLAGHAITAFTAATILSTPGSDRTSRLAA